MRCKGFARWGALIGSAFLIVALLQAAPASGAQAETPTVAAAARMSPPADPVRAPNGMVVSQSAIASEVGARVLERGGNAIDAAIATGFALAVTHPTAGNIGGGGFMVVRFPDGRSTTYDFREKAPKAAYPDLFVDSAGEYSYQRHHDSHLAVGVPGTVAGFWMAHGSHGSMDWTDLVDPSVRLAADGFPISADLAEGLEGLMDQARERDYQATIAAYSKGGTPYAEGESLRLPDLARTLGRIRDQGRDGFYRGETARLLAAEMVRGGGLITEEDLAAYQAVEREPVKGRYRGYELISMPPPSSGGVALIQMLNILEGYDLKAMGHNTPQYVHVVAESMRRAFLDRARHMGDPDFVDLPVSHLMDKTYAAELRSTIDLQHASTSDSADVAMAYESPETTHYSVVDKDGMAVSVTYTLEFGYGSRIVVPGAGFLLNNEMGDFNGKPGVTNSMGLIGTAANLALPEKRMLSSMSPSIVTRDGALVGVIGTPGGRTIINTVLEVFLNVVDFQMNIQEAVNAPRFHHQWLPDRLRIEEDGMDEAGLEALRAMGHEVSIGGRQGSANSIMIDPVTGDRLGAPDPRSTDAGAAGH